MTTVYSEGKGRNQVLPIKASTAYAIGDLLKWDAGTLIPASTGDAIVAICNEEIADTNTEKVNSSVWVPTERSGQFVMSYTGAGTLTPGAEYDLSTASVVDSAASTNDDVRLVKVLDATEKIAVFNIRFDGQY